MLQPEARHFLAGVEYATEAPDQDLFPGKGWAWELYVTYSEALGNAYYVVGSEAVSSSRMSPNALFFPSQGSKVVKCLKRGLSPSLLKQPQ